MGMEKAPETVKGQDVSSANQSVGTTSSSSMNQSKMASANNSSMNQSKMASANTNANNNANASSSKVNWRDIAGLVQSMNANSGSPAPVTFNAMSQPQPVANF